MKTDELIELLADAGAAVDRTEARRRFGAPLLVAFVLSIALVLVFLGPRPDWSEAAALPMFWLKFAFTGAVVAAAVAMLDRLGRPGSRLGATVAALAVPFAAVWLMAGALLIGAPAGERVSLVLGSSWLQCLLSIPALSVPALGLSLVAIRSMAPTRLHLAGAAAGLVAGAAAAFAYAIHCVEMQAPFLGVWYVLGMLVPAAAGALLGPRLLRW